MIAQFLAYLRCWEDSVLELLKLRLAFFFRLHQCCGGRMQDPTFQHYSSTQITCSWLPAMRKVGRIRFQLSLFFLSPMDGNTLFVKIKQDTFMLQLSRLICSVKFTGLNNCLFLLGVFFATVGSCTHGAQQNMDSKNGKEHCSVIILF